MDSLEWVTCTLAEATLHFLSVLGAQMKVSSIHKNIPHFSICPPPTPLFLPPLSSPFLFISPVYVFQPDANVGVGCKWVIIVTREWFFYQQSGRTLLVFDGNLKKKKILIIQI